MVLVSAFCFVVFGAAIASAQTVYSFEGASPTLNGWTAASASIVPSTTFGVTDGTTSMLIDDLTSGFKNDVGFKQEGAGSGVAFNYFDDAAHAIEAGKTNVKLEFDFSWDLTNITGGPQFAQLGMFLSSTGANFTQYGTGDLLGGNVGTGVTDFFPRLDPRAVSDGVALTSVGPHTLHLAIPLGPTKALNIGSGAPGTNYYQIGFKSNGSWGGTMDWAIDNIKFSGVQVPTTSETLFSWETPDNPSTPAVDERYEGWLPGGVGTNPPHAHSITTTGATDGTHALQIDRTGTPSGFTWGSSYTLNSVVNPGPSQTIDPAVQTQIDSLIGKINAADRVAFDITYKYQDLFPLPNPTYTGLGVFFADDAGHQYQDNNGSINVAAATNQTTTTIQLNLADFVDFNNNALTLKNTGLAVGSHGLQIALSTNTDGAQIYQIDNFRLITEVHLQGDYNGDGIVDASDYVTWRKGGSPTPNSLADYNTWRQHFGETLPPSGSLLTDGNAVPEPSALAMLLAAFVGSLFVARHKA